MRDVTFAEDRCQIRTGAAPQAVAACRNLTMALLRRRGHDNIAAALRTSAARPHLAVALVLSGESGDEMTLYNRARDLARFLSIAILGDGKEVRMTLLEAILDVVEQAEAVRPIRPDVSDRLLIATNVMLAEVPSLSVAEAAAILHQSRPTIRAWAKAGVLDAVWRGRSLRLSPQSVLAILPVVREWQANGAHGRPLRRLRQWLIDQVHLQAMADEVGQGRAQGFNPLLWPGGGGVLSHETLRRLAARGASAEPVAAKLLAQHPRAPFVSIHPPDRSSSPRPSDRDRGQAADGR